jgi:cell fate regulator YaaT (PSP1 superfamily)
MDTTQQDNNRENAASCTLDLGRGCEFSSAPASDTGAKVCEGCFKLHVTDWLKDYPDNLPTDIFEVRFKNTRRGYYHNTNNLPLVEGDIVAVEASPGHDIGIVSLTGDMVARQMRRVGFNPQNGDFKKIYRKAKPYDIEKWQEAIALEHGTMIRARQIAADMNLNMKIGDVEFQGDKIKAIFYYIADERVDFRELIKVFAEMFHVRVEMKQIGARQEAGRIGGLGACGRELCCASWMSGFLSVTTGAARAQEISLNPQKLAGQCSKLKCCMIYEYDDYMDARKEFPRVNAPLQTLDGDYFFVKNDILARTMSFSTAPGSMAGLVTLPIERVSEIMKLNAKGVKPEKINSEKNYQPKEVEPSFVNAIGEDSITRFDKTGRNNRKKNNRRPAGDRQTGGGEQSEANGQSGQGREPRREGQPRGEGGQRRENQPRREGGPRREDGEGQRRDDKPRNDRRQQGRPQDGDNTNRNNAQGSGNQSGEQQSGAQQNGGGNQQGGAGTHQGNRNNRNNNNRNRGGQNRDGRPREGQSREDRPREERNGQPRDAQPRDKGDKPSES